MEPPAPAPAPAPSPVATEASTSSAYFWRLFAVYIRNLLSTTSPPKHQYTGPILEEHIIPLLHRFGFISHCRDVSSLHSILLTLRASGFELPLRTARLSLSSDLILHSLLPFHLPPVSENMEDKTMPCRSISELSTVRSAFEFVKELLEHSFYLLRYAIDEAVKKFLVNAGCDNIDIHDNCILQTKICMLKEEFCWNICDEKRLLKYILEGANHQIGSNGQDNVEESWLSCFMRRGLQSPSKLARLQALRLAIACSFHSHYVFSKFFHLLETSLYLEDFGIREHLLSSLLDMIYMHHDKILFNDVSHIIIPFLYAPTVNLQLAAIIGCGRLLLFNCFPDETECLLGAMIERFVYESISTGDSLRPKPSSNKNPKQGTVLNVMSRFFREYVGENECQHQDEIANTIVYMCLEGIDEGVVLIMESSKLHVLIEHNEQQDVSRANKGQDKPSTIQNAILKYNNERFLESRSLHLALQMGLNMSHTIDAVLESLVLNINEQRQTVNHNLPLVTRNACKNWLLSTF